MTPSGRKDIWDVPCGVSLEETIAEAASNQKCIQYLLPAQRLSARALDRQVAEVQICAAMLSGFTVLGIPHTEVVR